MMVYKIMIGFAILIGSILIVENMVIGGQAQILIWYSRAGHLTIFSIFIGAILGFGIKGLLGSSSPDYNTDDFDY